MFVERPLWYFSYYSGVHMVINESDATDIQADIEGPIGTPYEGGIFRCKLAV
jgi:ubiquitin-conjugating enzyme E2 S